MSTNRRTRARPDPDRSGVYKMVEVVELPGGVNRGHGSLLSTAEIRPLNGRDEEWLTTSPASFSVAAAVSELISRCLLRLGGEAAPGDIAQMLLPADRDYLLLALRVATYGSRFDAVVTCPACSELM